MMLRHALLLLFPATLLAQSDVPLGEQVALYAEARMGKQVGRGECWDLAKEALNAAQARWDGSKGFGDPVQPEAVQRGDIVQLEKVVIERRDADSMVRETMGPHTAIVLEVPAPGHFLIAHQNFGSAGRKVSRHELRLADKKRGTITFFRPVK